MATKCPIHPESLMDPASYRCTACDHNHRYGRGGHARLRLQEKPLPIGHDGRYTITTRPDGTFRKGAIVELIGRLEKDPVLAAEFNAAVRRPPGVSRERHGVAIRAAVRSPMLTADPKSVRDGLDYNRHGRRFRPSEGMDYNQIDHRAMPKLHKHVKSLVVKPTNTKTARQGRNSPFWGERWWKVFDLKYAKGYVIITDDSDYSRTFPTIGELQSAVKSSGWEIIR